MAQIFEAFWGIQNDMFIFKNYIISMARIFEAF